MGCTKRLVFLASYLSYSRVMTKGGFLCCNRPPLSLSLVLIELQVPQDPEYQNPVAGVTHKMRLLLSSNEETRYKRPTS